jgi:hypothetical protein
VVLVEMVAHSLVALAELTLEAAVELDAVRLVAVVETVEADLLQFVIKLD